MAKARLDQPAEGVVRLGTNWVNWYLLADADGVTIVDCGLPGYHEQLEAGLAALGRGRDDVAAIVLTHHHTDHVGSAEELRTELGVPVYAPAAEVACVKGEEKGGDLEGMIANLWRPRLIPFLVHAARSGGMAEPEVGEVDGYEPGEVIGVPGSPRAVSTPGHTKGHCSLHVADRGVLFAGDALGTMSVKSGPPGPQLAPFNEDGAQARSSLANLEGIEAGTLLCGHGEPHHGPLADAVATARTRSEL